MLRSDNGGEYTSDAFKHFCITKCIVQRFTPPNTPKANSVSERFNRVLSNRARAVIIGSKLPLFLWCYVMAAITYLYNRTISPRHSDKSPYELIFGAKPNVSHLRAYGCYMYNFAASSKLQSRALKGALIGYDTTSSAYLIYVPETKSIRRSGHVAFNEYQLLFTDETKAAADKLHLALTIRPPVMKPSIVQKSPSAPPVVMDVTQPTSTLRKRQLLMLLSEGFPLRNVTHCLLCLLLMLQLRLLTLSKLFLSPWTSLLHQ